MQQTFRKFLPHIFIAIGFLVLSYLYAFPLLQGKKLVQGDVVSWIGMSHEAKTYADSTGKTVLWTNSMFGGMPSYMFYMSGEHNYIYKIIDVIEGMGAPAGYLFLAMLTFYILMCVTKVDKWLGVVGAIAYAFSTYNVIIMIAGHNTKMMSISCLPAIIAGLLLLYRGRWLSGSALLGVFMALLVTESHWQMVYYTAIIVLFVVLGQFFLLLKEKQLGRFFTASIIAVVVAAISFGPNMSGILTTLEYAKESQRGGQSGLSRNKTENASGGLDKDYAFSWSNGIGETFCILVPGLYGRTGNENVGTSSNTYETLTKLNVSDDQAAQFTEQLPMYWGPQPFLSGPVYFGAIICFLFVLGLIIVRSPHKWWIIALCMIGIVMSWGKHFAALNYFLFDHLPGLNKFRTPSMILIIPEFLFPLLAIWALNDIIKEKISKEEVWKKVKVAAIITGGLCLVLGLGSKMFFDFREDTKDAAMQQQLTQAFRSPDAAAQVVSAIREDRADMAMKSALLSAFFIAAAAGLLWAYSKNKVKANTLIIGLGILIAADLIKEDIRYLNADSYKEPDDYAAAFEPRQVDKEILKDKDPYYRVLDLTKDTYNDAIQAYFHKCIGGYSAVKLQSYQDLIDHQLNQHTGKFNMQVLNMLNTKYIIIPTQGGATVRPNPDACGNAWFVNDVKWANNADEEMNGLNANYLGDTSHVIGGFDPKQIAIMNVSFKNDLGNYQPAKDSTATIRLKQYGLDNISYTSNSNEPGLAVFSDIYYPYGWKAYIDDKETPIMKADYVLRAVKIPGGGTHTIEFRFHPKSFYTGDEISIITSILLYTLCIIAIVLAIRANNKEEKPV